MKGINTYKEILGQKKAIEAINNNLKNTYEVLDEVFDSTNEWDEIICIGCGTSLYIAQSVSSAINSYTRIPSRSVPCSEIFYYPENYAKKGKKILVIPFTRNSQTTEVKKAINRIREFSGVKTLSITCDQKSKIYNDYMIYSPDASEKSVVMTTSYTSMLYLGILVALYLTNKKNEIKRIASELFEQMQLVIDDFDIVAKEIISAFQDLNLFVVLGQGAYYGVANECMNKIKEMAIENTEAYYTLEYRHGPMSVVDENSLLIVFSTKTTHKEDDIFINEMKSYGAKVLSISINCNPSEFAHHNYVMRNELDDIQNTVPASVIGQLIGYYRAKAKNIDADSPRHLSQAIILEE